MSLASDTALLAFHDAVELFLHLACDQHGVSLKPKASFEDYFAALSEKVGPLASKVSMMRLNEARRNLKHHGNLPHVEDMESFRFGVQAFFDENTPRLFNGVGFSDVTLADMVACAKARKQLVSAADHWQSGRLGEASTSLALAYDELRWDYLERNRDPRWGGNPFALGPSLTFMSGASLGLDGNAQRVVDDVLDSIRHMRRALEITVLGVDYKRHVEFTMLTPSVQRMAGGSTSVVRTHSRDLSEQEYERCYGFVIEAALKLQEFDFLFAFPREDGATEPA